MKFSRPDAKIWGPSDETLVSALERTTHLGIGAHQDDLEIMAFHGISECYDNPEKHFTGVTCTDGSSSARAGQFAEFTDDHMRDTRIREQERAAEIGRYSAMIQLLHPSEEVKDPSNHILQQDLAAILQAAQPSFLYVHNPADKHETHIAVCVESIRAIRELPPDARPDRVLGCEVWRGLDWMLDKDKVGLGLGDRAPLADQLISIFESQIAGGKRYDLASQGRRLANATYHQPHEVDAEDGIWFAMDLTPLAKNGTIDILDYTLSFVERFENDVREKLSVQLGRE